MPTSAREYNNGTMWASSPTAVNYIQLQIIIFVGTFTPDGPCKINRKRTVEDACPYGEIIVYVTDKLQFEYPNCTAEENFRRLLLGGTTVYEGTPSDTE